MNEFKVGDLIPESLINRFHLEEVKDISGLSSSCIKPLIEGLRTEKKTIQARIKDKLASGDSVEGAKAELHVVCSKIKVLLNCKQTKKIGYA